MRSRIKKTVACLSILVGGFGSYTLADTTIDKSAAAGIEKRPTIDTEINKCQIINWQPGNVYTITGSMDMATHIMFPENKVDVVVGNAELWTEESRLNHVFVKPNTDKVEGAQTTLSFISEANNSFEFVIKRVPIGQGTSCVVIKKNGRMLSSTKWETSHQREQRLFNAFATKVDSIKKEMANQQRNALDKYRETIYTGYDFPKGNGWFSSNFVDDVYDDGRWTYIRVKSDNRGVMAIYGEIDGKKNILQFSYDEVSKIYRIAGIYQKLILKYGKDTVTITRKGG